ncbi:MAG: SHOCT domain-containing protein [Planctomycetes bacterium]|nr:SHOCT domain-containing protein [Planctomycetota bacterium]
MSFKNVCIAILLLFSLGETGCLNLGTSGSGNSNQNAGLNVYNTGKSYVKLKESSVKEAESGLYFDHPKFLRNDYVTNAMSSVFFKERGIKGWGKEQNVFQESELLNLLPHVTGALSKASPSQYAIVTSHYQKGKSKFLKTELYTIFAVFVANEKLNIRFSRIQYVPVLENDDDGIFTGNRVVFTDPFSLKSNPSWKLITRPGQRLKEGYSNWLVIDLQEDALVKEEQKSSVSPHNVEGVGHVQEKRETLRIDEGNSTSTFHREARTSIKDQLVELKELEKTGLITSEDYDRRKAEILVGKQEKSIKDKFIELRNLSEDGYIGAADYEREKREILDKLEVSGKRIKEVLVEYLELRDEGFITDDDYEYIKKKLLMDF